MMDYSLCNQKVTCYRMVAGQLQRQVLENCYLEYSTRVEHDGIGRNLQRPFLLIVPGRGKILAEDLIYDGEGPQTPDIPANDPGFMQVQYVTEYPEHTEAGRNKHSLSAI